MAEDSHLSLGVLGKLPKELRLKIYEEALQAHNVQGLAKVECCHDLFERNSQLKGTTNILKASHAVCAEAREILDRIPYVLEYSQPRGFGYRRESYPFEVKLSDQSRIPLGRLQNVTICIGVVSFLVKDSAQPLSLVTEVMRGMWPSRYHFHHICVRHIYKTSTSEDHV